MGGGAKAGDALDLELAGRGIQDLKAAIHNLSVLAQQDGENIRALARFAGIRERRLTELQGGECGEPANLYISLGL